jgi:hypothetical protein
MRDGRSDHLHGLMGFRLISSGPLVLATKSPRSSSDAYVHVEAYELQNSYSHGLQILSHAGLHKGCGHSVWPTTPIHILV